MKKSLLSLLVFSVAGCSAPPTRQTYDAINAELKQAALSKPAPAVPLAVADALLPPLKPAAAPVEERFSIAFSDIPARQFFAAIASGTRYNLLVHPDVSGTISADLKKVTLFEALDAVRNLYGYDYVVDGKQIIIKPLTMQTRVFHVNYLNNSRRGTSDTRVSAGSGSSQQNQNSNANGAYPGSNASGAPNASPNLQGQAQSSSINSTSNSDFWGELNESLRAILNIEERDGKLNNNGGRSVVVSRQSGVIVVRAMPEELRSVAAYLKAAQISVERQVILEAKILEVQLNEGYQTGINWASFATIGGNPATIGMIAPGTSLSTPKVSRTMATSLATTNTVSGNSGNTALSAVTGAALAATGNAAGSLFGLAFQTNNFAALLSFLESQGSVQVLSSPRIATLNNQKAILKVGTDDFFVTKVSSTTNATAVGQSTTPDVTLQQFFSGVVLDVTPQIDEQDNIILHVHPSVTQVTTLNRTVDLGSAGTLILPLASSNTSETDSVVRGQHGQIIAIGGLMRQASSGDRSQLPGAGDVPFLGGLFRSTSGLSQKRELVILIKPTIVDGPGNWSNDVLESQKRILSLDPQVIGK